MNKTDSNEKNLISKFLETFINNTKKVLMQTLDSDICTAVSFVINSTSEVKNPETLKENNIIYRIEYATGNCQSSVSLLIPEVLVYNVADILMGGSGDKEYKGTLSELEINSVNNLMDKIFKEQESAFKQGYNQDLAFSNKPLFLTKEMPDYTVNSEGVKFDMLVDTTLTLAEGNDYKVGILLMIDMTEQLMSELGLSKIHSSTKKVDISSLDIKRISDVKIDITAELGRTRVPIKYALELVRGSLIELDTLNNSDIKVFANGVEFARAQVVAIEDNFGLRITKIVSPEERLDYI